MWSVGGGALALVIGFQARADHEARLASLTTVVAIVVMLLVCSFGLQRVSGLARKQRELLNRARAEALTDALTALPNRRKLFADLEALLREGPTGEEVALGMFDLDGFKRYNDTFGHPAGDLLLARLGRRLAAAIDGRGAAYRMGGDEFCVIVRGPGSEHVLAAAAEALSDHGESYSVGCSRGSVVLSTNELTLDEALQQADQRLYDSKRSSRRGPGAAVTGSLVRAPD